MNDNIWQRYRDADRELAELTSGKQFRMCIPVQNNDSDVLLGQSLRDVPLLIKENGRLRKALRQAADNLDRIANDNPLNIASCNAAITEIEKALK